MSQWGGAKAIETVYKDHRFRSRLEARWALFMDECEVPWQYEPEGFDLDGTRYLPDFWLPSSGIHGDGIWMEAKPVAPSYEERRKAQLLARHTQTMAIIAVGPPKAPMTFEEAVHQHLEYIDPIWPHPSKDPVDDAETQFYGWTECRFCGLVGIAETATPDYLPCRCTVPLWDAFAELCDLLREKWNNAWVPDEISFFRGFFPANGRTYHEGWDGPKLKRAYLLATQARFDGRKPKT